MTGCEIRAKKKEIARKRKDGCGVGEGNKRERKKRVNGRKG